MAGNGKAAAIEEPDWGDLSLPERADWFLAMLRQMPGSAYEHDGIIWHRLDAEDLLELMGGLAPSLTENQLRGASNLLGRQGMRRSIKRGGGKYTHLIAPASSSVQWDLEELLVRGNATLYALRNRIAALQAKDAAQVKKIEELTAQVEQFTAAEAARRTQPPAAIDLFRDGLNEAEKSLQE